MGANSGDAKKSEFGTRQNAKKGPHANGYCTKSDSTYIPDIGNKNTRDSIQPRLNLIASIYPIDLTSVLNATPPHGKGGWRGELPPELLCIYIGGSLFHVKLRIGRYLLVVRNCLKIHLKLNQTS